MKRWALLVAFLYFLIIVALTLPVGMAAFWPLKANQPHANLTEAFSVFLAWQYWLLPGILVLSQAALLTVPVRVAGRRPVSRRSLLPPILVSEIGRAHV